MSLNAFTDLVRDCGLDKWCSASLLTYVFHQVNAVEKKTAHMDTYNAKNLLNRHEYLQCIVRIAIEQKGAGRPDTPTVSAAVEQLCEDIADAAPVETQQDSNAFRKMRCYNELTDRALRQHEGSLRRIFEVYAASNTDKDDKLYGANMRTMMSVGEFCRFLEHIGLFEMEQIS